MDYEEMLMAESCAEELLRSVDATGAPSALAIAPVCGLTVVMEGTSVSPKKVRGARVVIPATPDFLLQEEYCSIELAAHRLRRKYGPGLNITDELAAYCGRSILTPRESFERELRRLRAGKNAEAIDAGVWRDVRKLSRIFIYARESLIRERIEDLRMLHQLSAPRLRLVVA